MIKLMLRVCFKPMSVHEIMQSVACKEKAGGGDLGGCSDPAGKELQCIGEKQ